jgi:hypothetical protein
VAEAQGVLARGTAARRAEADRMAALDEGGGVILLCQVLPL